CGSQGSEDVPTYLADEIPESSANDGSDGPGLSGGGDERPQQDEDQDQPAPGSLAESLERLNINLDKGNRLDEDGTELPESFGPFGARWQPAVRAELYAAGLAGMVDTSNDAVLVDDFTTQGLHPLLRGEARIVPDLLAQEAEGETEGRAHRGRNTRALLSRAKRATVAADVDGDGIDEVVSVRLHDGRVILSMMDDKSQGHASSEVELCADAGANSVALEAIDLDGKGFEGLAIASEGPGAVTLRFAALGDEGWALRPELEKSLPLQTDKHEGEHAPILAMAAGNLDRDGGEELAVVLNELWVDASQNETAEARWFVYDDAASGQQALIDGEAVTGRSFELVLDPRTDENVIENVDYKAVFADVSIADFDDDMMGEIALGGMLDMGAPNTAALESEEADKQFDDGRRPLVTQYVMMMRDGLRRLKSGEVQGLEAIGAKAFKHSWLQGDNDRSKHDRQRHTVQANALNADGIGRPEFQMNQYLLGFEAPDDGSAEFHARHISIRGTMQDTTLLNPALDAAHFTPAVAAIATGDVTGDGRDDIVVAHEGIQQVSVYSMVPGTNTPWSFGRNGQITRDERTMQDLQVQGGHPVLLLPNVDKDSISLRYTPSKRKLVFTEPVIHAVLAAAPGKEGIGQNLAANMTAWGVGSSQGSGSTFGASISSSVWVGAKAGFKAFGQGIEVEVKQTISTSLEKLKSKRYNTAEKVTYSNVYTERDGLTNLVIFSTLPVDVYEYTVLSHPDPEQVGQIVSVALPRRAITAQTTLEQFNRVVVGDKPNLDSVLPPAGDLSSYPTRSAMEVATGNGRGLATKRTITVGQTGNAVGTLELSIEEEEADEEVLSINVERSVEVTAGPAIAGFSVGAGTSKSLSVTPGRSSTFVGQVGGIFNGV
ncbi:MAG: hypothetical protein P1V36_18045, partial [Planctomycetota bacterium]|nr:hypothetical protein [Planctomycetota bacterium]